ncbi:MAG: DNA repair protein RadA [Gammaproteobacteria bacterium]|nr:MAG: DNA repair protein RadA [Gammaproteobacteria bacterium]
MAKSTRLYQCEACGAEAPKWSGQCPACGAWNSLHERHVTPAPRAGALLAPAAGAEPCDLDAVPAIDQARTPTGLSEFDRVLGGGLVDGAVVLLGGDPGVGKSTLLLQALAALADRRRALYVSGEESLQQVGLRARRLGLADRPLRLLADTVIERVLETAAKERAELLVIDSIQTMFSEALASAPGSVAQVRECAARLVRFAKDRAVTVFIVGHVTKEGALAGPRVLEHMVDTVLYFEGEPGSRYRMVRAVKNRFGAAHELGVFAMLEDGLKPVTNPSAIFLSRHARPVPGSVVTVALEGTRPLLVEVQALVDAAAAAPPRRLAVGLDGGRLALLLAVLHRHTGAELGNRDVFANVVGGVRLGETAADLAVLLAVRSSLYDKPLPDKLVVFGEVGLAGEIRPVPNGEARLAAAAKHGFARALMPAANRVKRPPPNIDAIGVDHLDEALAALERI